MPFHIRPSLKKIMNGTRIPTSAATVNPRRSKHRISTLLSKISLRASRTKASQASGPERNPNRATHIPTQETRSPVPELALPAHLQGAGRVLQTAQTGQPSCPATPPAQLPAEDPSILSHRSDALLALEGRRDLMSTSNTDITYREFFDFATIPGSVYHQIYLEGSRQYTSIVPHEYHEERGASYCPTIDSERFSVGSCVPGVLDDLESIRSSLDPGASMKSVALGAGCDSSVTSRSSVFCQTNGLRATLGDSVNHSLRSRTPLPLRRKPAMMFAPVIECDKKLTIKASLHLLEALTLAGRTEVPREHRGQGVPVEATTSLSRIGTIDEGLLIPDRALNSARHNPNELELKIQESHLDKVSYTTPIANLAEAALWFAAPTIQESQPRSYGSKPLSKSQHPTFEAGQLSMVHTSIPVEETRQPVDFEYVFVEICDSGHILTGQIDYSRVTALTSNSVARPQDRNAPHSTMGAVTIRSSCRRFVHCARDCWKSLAARL